MIFVHNPHSSGCVDHIAWHHIDNRINFIKFGQLILAKIIKIVATRCQILRPKCTKFDFGWGSAPIPAGRASAPQTPFISWWEGSFALPTQEPTPLSTLRASTRFSHAFFFPNLGMSDKMLLQKTQAVPQGCTTFPDRSPHTRCALNRVFRRSCRYIRHTVPTVYWFPPDAIRQSYSFNWDQTINC